MEVGKGCLLEVDGSCLQSLHNNLPFVCKKKRINEAEKLVPSLYDKTKYVIHIMPLNQALEHGLVLEKFHWVIEFGQSAWLAIYIDFNTQLRIKVKNDFKKDFFKLMNNSVFRKTMENFRRHRDINLMMNEEVYHKMVMKPNFKSRI